VFFVVKYECNEIVNTDVHLVCVAGGSSFMFCVLSLCVVALCVVLNAACVSGLSLFLSGATCFSADCTECY
jgi:hypothetical protein